jgi:hypothetical protein
MELMLDSESFGARGVKLQRAESGRQSKNLTKNQNDTLQERGHPADPKIQREPFEAFRSPK